VAGAAKAPDSDTVAAVDGQEARLTRRPSTATTDAVVKIAYR